MLSIYKIKVTMQCALATNKCLNWMVFSTILWPEYLIIYFQRSYSGRGMNGDKPRSESTNQSRVLTISTNESTVLRDVTNESMLVSVINGSESQTLNSAVRLDCVLLRGIYVYLLLLFIQANGWYQKMESFISR